MASCNEKLVSDVSNLVKLGIPPLTAAISKGVSEEEFVEWMRRGEVNARGDWRYADFFVAVTSGQAEAESLLVGRIRNAATDNWQAAAWLLERLFPQRYVRKSVSGDDTKREPIGADPFTNVDKVVPIQKAGRRK